MNFETYFFREEFDGLGLDDKYLKPNTGNHHHQSLGRVTKMGDRKSFNMVAKSQSQPKKSLHPKVDLCIKTKKNISLVGNEPVDIMKKYEVCPTPEEPKKTLNSEIPVKINMIKPNVYILTYEEI